AVFVSSPWPNLRTPQALDRSGIAMNPDPLPTDPAVSATATACQGRGRDGALADPPCVPYPGRRLPPARALRRGVDQPEAPSATVLRAEGLGRNPVGIARWRLKGVAAGDPVEETIATLPPPRRRARIRSRAA